MPARADRLLIAASVRIWAGKPDGGPTGERTVPPQHLRE
jgi:hypothetical protein